MTGNLESAAKTADLAKRAAGEAAADLVEEGMLVGLGTGSTAAHFIKRLGLRCQQGLKVRCVATSNASAQLGKSCGLTVVEMAGITSVDVTVDGADEIDRRKCMIKGGGGALLREKILASISQEMIVVVDAGKVVQRLGAFPLPVEVVAFGFDATVEQIRRFGFSLTPRKARTGELFVTDGGNHIVDIDLKGDSWIPQEVDQKLKTLPGVIESGFFFGLAGRVLIGRADGSVEIWNSTTS